MGNKNLEINLLYRSSTNDCYTFFEIRKGTGLISIEDSNIETFWIAQGGLEILIDGGITIFHTIDIEYLMEAVNFLCLTICKIHSIKLESDITFFDIPNDNVLILNLRTVTKSFLEVNAENSESILLSLKVREPQNRTSRYLHTYDNIEILKETWTQEALNALEDFFFVFKQLLEKGHYSNAPYSNYIKLWERLKQYKK